LDAQRRTSKKRGVDGTFKAENAYADAVLKPVESLIDKLYKEMLGRTKKLTNLFFIKSVITGTPSKPSKVNRTLLVSGAKAQ
jgi:protease II